MIMGLSVCVIVPDYYKDTNNLTPQLTVFMVCNMLMAVIVPYGRLQNILTFTLTIFGIGYFNTFKLTEQKN